MVLAVILLAAGTVVEKINPTIRIYNTWWFIAFMAVMAVVIIVNIVHGKIWKQLHLLLIHASIVIIMLGGALTTWTGQHGSITLQQGVPTNSFVADNGIEVHLPFTITLDHFEIIHYPGTSSPMDYVSHITTDNEHYDISMNHIYRRSGYRFYQEDYGKDGSSILSVAHDPMGITVTYIGYSLLILGLLGMFVVPNSHFRKLLKRATVMAVLLLPVASSMAAPHTLPRESAKKMGEMYVLYHGRICPLQTLAKDFTTKLTGKATYHGLSSEQVLAGWLFYYNEWQSEPMLKIKGSEVRQLLGIDGRYASIADFTDNYGTNIVSEELIKIPPMDSRSKNLRSADEKFNLLQMLKNGQLLKLFPLVDSTGSIGWYSQNDALPLNIPDDEYLFVRKQLSYCQELVVLGDFEALNKVFEKTRHYQEQHAAGLLPTTARVKAERLYNVLTPGRWLAIMSIALGVLFFGVVVVRIRHCFIRIWRTCSVVWIGLLTAFLILIFVLRWIAGGHVPMAGGFDSMNLMAIAIGLIALIIHRRYTMAPAIGSLAMGFCLLVAMMSGSNPPVTQLMPVLSSPLLALHVTVIMGSYALFFFIMLNGVAGLVLRRQAATLQRIGLLMLYPAVFLLATGIVIGALWANISWGNYWSWDPKEVWALITLIIYALPLQLNQKPISFHLFCIFAFLSVIITYFGVNLILGGIHAYN